MSTLDNVFIRAYSRDTDPASAARRIGRPITTSETVSHSIIIGEATADANFYRIDSIWAEQSQLVMPLLPNLPDTRLASADIAQPAAGDAADAADVAAEKERRTMPETDSAAVEPAIGDLAGRVDSAKPLTTKVPGDESREGLRPVRLDAGSADVPGAHFRLMPRVPDVRAGQDAARTSKLESAVPKGKFVPVWEVEKLIWSEAAQDLSQHAEDALQGAGVYLRGACREGLRVLAVTSGSRCEGRTTIALCLARAVAASGIRVAILDADLENPDLANHIGLEAACGWEEVIHGRLPLEEVAIHSLADRVTVIPLTAAIADQPIELEDQRVTALVRGAAELFDLVIIDMGPIGTTNRKLFESGTHCPIDAAIIIRDLRASPAEPTFTIGARLRSSGVKSVGIVENFAPRVATAGS